MTFPVKEPLIGLWGVPHAGDPERDATFARSRGIDLGGPGPRRRQKRKRGREEQLQKQKDEDVGVGDVQLETNAAPVSDSI